MKLWHDLWCGDTILKKSYPELFGISCNKDSSIADVQFHNGITGFAIFETCAILGVRIFVKFYGFNSFLTGWRNGEDSFAGSWIKVGVLKWEVIIFLWCLLQPYLFHGKLFGNGKSRLDCFLFLNCCFG